jgi:hypothetical protein
VRNFSAKTAYMKRPRAAGIEWIILAIIRNPLPRHGSQPLHLPLPGAEPKTHRSGEPATVV